MKDSEHTFFGLGDYREQKKREKDAPYDNISMSHNDGVEVKVNSFTCFNQTRTWRVVQWYAPLSFNGRSIS